MNVIEIENQLDNKDKEILRAQQALNDVQSAQYDTRKRLIELTEAVRQAKFNISRMRTEKELLTRAFWRQKNG